MPELDTTPPFHLPRIRIAFCTQCKWMLRAAYYAQELLSTFSTSIGEIALVPSTGGVFVVDILYHPPATTATSSSSTTSTLVNNGSTSSTTTLTPSTHDNAEISSQEEALQPRRQVLWDRKVEGGFPETKILKRLVRDCIEPERGLGHVDGVKSTSTSTSTSTSKTEEQGDADSNSCECRNEPTDGGGDGRRGKDEKDGKDGRPGKDGRDERDGRDIILMPGPTSRAARTERLQ